MRITRGVRNSTLDCWIADSVGLTENFHPELRRLADYEIRLGSEARLTALSLPGGFKGDVILSRSAFSVEQAV
jgi:hypothetical protein